MTPKIEAARMALRNATPGHREQARRKLREAMTAELRAEMNSAASAAAPCATCGGAGWVWWDELENYSGPANETGRDDTHYSCPDCEPSLFDRVEREEAA